MKKISFVTTCLFITTCAFSQVEYSIEDSRKYILDGAKLHDEKKYDEAIAEYKKVNRNDTNYVLALVELATTYVAMEKDSLAVEVCNNALKQVSRYNPNLLLLKANALDNLKKTDEAVKTYEEGIEKYPLNNSFYFEMGILNYRKEKYKEAHDWAVKSLQVNPYHPASHNLMGSLAIKQGKLIPAMLAWQFYLILDNSSSRAKLLITSLEELAKNEYEFDNAVKVEQLSEQDDFAELESLVKSKIALSGKYKSKIKLQYDLVKQLQLIAEKIEVNKNDKGFYMQFYAPFFAELNKTKNFEPFVYTVLSDMGIEAVNSWNKKNKMKVDAMAGWIVQYISDNYSTIETEITGEKEKLHTWFSSLKLSSIGNKDAAGNQVGNWKYFYSNGIVRSEGFINDKGKVDKVWKYYYPTGIIKETDTYNNGVLEGELNEYYSDGTINKKKNYSNGLLEGTQYIYYPTGGKSVEYDCIKGKQEGNEISYYKNGKIKYQTKLINEKYEGEIIQYYESGRIMDKSMFIASARNGHATSYWDVPENTIKSEGDYVKNNVSGEWKFYHENGKLKDVGSYDAEGYKNGLWKSYNKQGVLIEEENYINGNLDGYSKFYDDDGGLTEEYIYKKSILQEYKAYDGKGNKISENKKDGKDSYDVLLYHPNGNKRKEGRVQKGSLQGSWKEYNENGFITNEQAYEQGKKQGKSISYHTNGAIASVTEYANGSSAGIFKRYFENGKLKKEGGYIDDTEQGEWRIYFPDGNISSVLYYRDGSLDGWQQYFAVNGKLDYEEFIEYNTLKKRIYYDSTLTVLQEIALEKGTGALECKYPNGKPYIKSNFKNGLLDGDYITYYSNGKTKSTRFFVDGNLEGALTFFYADGKKEAEYNYMQGEREGKYKYYFENGDVQREIDYVKGYMEGKNVVYYPNKNLERSSEYKNGKLNGSSAFYAETGDMMIERQFKDGNLMQYTYLDKTENKVTPLVLKNSTGAIKAYYKNGSVSIEYNMQNGELEGKRVMYHVNGKPESEDYFYCGTQDSIAKYYYPSGILKSEVHWLVDHKHGKSVAYYATGKIENEEYFLNDSKHGACKYYDVNGKLVKTAYYYNGNLLSEN